MGAVLSADHGVRSRSLTRTMTTISIRFRWRLTVDALLHRARRAVRNLRAGNPSRESLNAAANIIEALLDERYPLPSVAGESRTTPMGPEDDRELRPMTADEHAQTLLRSEEICCCVFAVHDKCPVHGNTRGCCDEATMTDQVRATAAHAVAMLQAARDAAPAEWKALMDTPPGYWLPSAISDLREALERQAAVIIGIDWATTPDVFVLHCPDGSGHSNYFESWEQVPDPWDCTCGRAHPKPSTAPCPATSAPVAGLR